MSQYTTVQRTPARRRARSLSNRPSAQNQSGALARSRSMPNIAVSPSPVAPSSRTISAEDLDMSNAAPVISRAQKFILPIGNLKDGVELRYPAGHEQAGEKILDFEKQPIGDHGVIFYNSTDNSVQAVQGDDSGVIIFNLVNQSQADLLRAKHDELAKASSTPGILDHAGILAFLDYATSLGLTDRYNSTREFIRKRMTPVGDQGANEYGLYKRDDRDICHAVRLDGSGVFKGPAASPQKFEDGAVIVQQGQEYRLVQCDAFEQSYCYSDNTAIDARELPLGVR